jgi:hypothetical protein
MTRAIISSLILCSLVHAAVTVNCAKGMKPEACQRDAQQLALLLNMYKAAELGDWQFVIQNSNDWPRKNHPGMTDFDARRTYLESALFEGQSSRAAEFLVTWHEPIETFAAHVVSHELAHVMCRSRDEDLAEENGARIRRGQNVVCQ